MITVYWDNPQQTIIRLDYAHPVASWDEYRTAVNQSYALAQSVNHHVHIIHHTIGVPMPSSQTHDPFEQLNQAIMDLPDNVDVAVSVTDRPLERRITKISLDISVKTDHRHIYIVPTLDDAYKLIHAFDNDDLDASV